MKYVVHWAENHSVEVEASTSEEAEEQAREIYETASQDTFKGLSYFVAEDVE